MTPEQRAALDPAGQEWHLRVKGSQNQLFGWLVYTVLLWTLKTCMLIFFSRLTYVATRPVLDKISQLIHSPSDNVTHMKMRIRIGAVMLATTFVATFFAILFGCYPIKKHWQINPDPGSTYLRITRILIYTYKHRRSLPARSLKAPGGRLDHAQHID